MMFIILISAMRTIQIHNHNGTARLGSNFHRHTATNTKSAAVSSFAPNSVTVPVFRATRPSIISVSPAARYKKKNDREKTGQSSKATLHRMRMPVMRLAIRIFNKGPPETRIWSTRPHFLSDLISCVFMVKLIPQFLRQTDGNHILRVLARVQAFV